MASSGALSNVQAIAMEYHHHIDPNVDRLSEMLEMLERNGFEDAILLYYRRHPNRGLTM
jgi:hypothetical protein